MSSFEKDFSSSFKEMIGESIAVKKQVLESSIPKLNKITNVMYRCLSSGHKLLLCGNGGSAADSQHIAAEFVSKFRRDRQALPAIALTTDTSILTSIGNDYSFDDVFARQVEAWGQEGDVAIGISTSGNSPNVLKAMAMARERGLITVGLTGLEGGKLKDTVDHCFHAPTQSTPRIQEVHITVAHAVCELLEQQLC